MSPRPVKSWCCFLIEDFFWESRREVPRKSRFKDDTMNYEKFLYYDGTKLFMDKPRLGCNDEENCRDRQAQRILVGGNEWNSSDWNLSIIKSIRRTPAHA